MLWAELVSLNLTNEKWIVVGDFNIIWNDSERHGGCPRLMLAMQEFNDCIDTCGLLEFPTFGSWFSWCNKHGGQAHSWMRLDHTLLSSSALLYWPKVLVKYLPQTTSNHAPMILQIC